jgi:2-methylisocitrate lyase-like PEP mutase family enzyme
MQLIKPPQFVSTFIGGFSMAMAIAQQDKAGAFLDLHRNQDLFILPNAWDAASARVFERASFSAIGTTSAGIAASLG